MAPGEVYTQEVEASSPGLQASASRREPGTFKKPPDFFEGKRRSKTVAMTTPSQSSVTERRIRSRSTFSSFCG